MRQRADDFARDFERFKAKFDAGWNNRDKDGIGNFWMNATTGAVVGSLGQQWWSLILLQELLRLG